MNQALYSSYKTHQRSLETGRETEARALLSCASKLEDAKNPDVSWEELEAAIKLNQRLWTIFQASLCDEESPLPRDLRTTLLNLSIYVDKTSFTILAENNRQPLESIININRTLAKGLSMNNQAPQQQTASTQTSRETDHAPISTSA